MARQIIVLERQDAEGNRPTFRFLMWAPVPVARQAFYANAAAASVYRDATQAEIDALRAGAVVERVETFTPTAGSTLAQIKTQLQARWTAYAAEVTAANTFTRYGSSWDGTTWIDAGA